jgi:hypothetical protein
MVDSQPPPDCIPEFSFRSHPVRFRRQSDDDDDNDNDESDDDSEPERFPSDSGDNPDEEESCG